MTKEEVKRILNTGNGKAIALAMRTYFAQRIAQDKIKPLEFYDPKKENIFGKNDIVDDAKDIFSV